MPWFWSLQAGARLQIAGLSRPDDDAVALASADPHRFSIGRVREGRLVAVESIN
ncbi:oxidoreductase C-terminal domain-containing protein, partial [Bacillus sp. SIMBA_154]|uniref:oxidoreductase C-terminal domain-containing protein n=1 Tax=Bacillus sp. SIMBA_154 TaxID=3080859 RepID=UPI003978E743